jgi:hypothetical protein
MPAPERGRHRRAQLDLVPGSRPDSPSLRHEAADGADDASLARSLRTEAPSSYDALVTAGRRLPCPEVKRRRYPARAPE